MKRNARQHCATQCTRRSAMQCDAVQWYAPIWGSSACTMSKFCSARFITGVEIISTGWGEFVFCKRRRYNTLKERTVCKASCRRFTRCKKNTKIVEKQTLDWEKSNIEASGDFKESENREKNLKIIIIKSDNCLQRMIFTYIFETQP